MKVKETLPAIISGATDEADFEHISSLVMGLPDLKEKLFEKKRQAAEPDVTVLKDQQLEAFTGMRDFLQQKTGGMFLLKGFAGTGKTFTIQRVIEWFLSANRGILVAMTAPTNKAVKVLMEAAEFTHPNLHFSTVHRILGLKEQIDSYGKQKFVQDKKYPPSIEKYKVVIVDEVSMLSDDLCKELERYIQPPWGVKFIFMGDPAQIPPVGKADCLPFDARYQKKHSIPVSELTEIVRQAAGNPIIEVTMKIRNALGRPNSFPLRRTILDEDGKGVIMLASGNPDHAQFVSEYLEKFFTSENFKKDADFMKVICWRNKTVDGMNRWIRAKVYGKVQSRNRIVIGEKLIANKPIVEDKVILFSTNDEFEVMSFEERTEPINEGQFNLKYYAALVRQQDYTGFEKTNVIKIIHEESLETYIEIVEALKSFALSKKQGTWEAGAAWQDYYEFQEKFADVNYNYAITGHKSQGSTYDNVLVMAHDIDANNNVTERNRIKYTACSRPKNRLIIVC